MLLKHKYTDFFFQLILFFELIVLSYPPHDAVALIIDVN